MRNERLLCSLSIFSWRHHRSFKPTIIPKGRLLGILLHTLGYTMQNSGEKAGGVFVLLSAACRCREERASPVPHGTRYSFTTHTTAAAAQSLRAAHPDPTLPLRSNSGYERHRCRAVQSYCRCTVGLSLQNSTRSTAVLYFQVVVFPPQKERKREFQRIDQAAVRTYLVSRCYDTCLVN